MAAAIVYAVLAYLSAGLLFAGPFALRGVGTIDAAARHAHWGFRLLIIPGAAAFWPLLLIRWIAARRTSSTEQHP